MSSFQCYTLTFSSRRRHTRSDRDWSSDVCSSDLTLFLSQAEDGIRDLIVTGVQTCALLISSRRRHTRSDRDWSSDVCSSDLFAGYGFPKAHSTYAFLAYQTAYLKAHYPWHFAAALLTIEAQNADKLEIGRASCRERV